MSVTRKKKASQIAEKIVGTMSEWESGPLHSKEQGPVAKSQKQLDAIILSNARKAGSKAPKKSTGK